MVYLKFILCNFPRSRDFRGKFLGDSVVLGTAATADATTAAQYCTFKLSIDSYVAKKSSLRAMTDRHVSFIAYSFDTFIKREFLGAEMH